MARISTKTTIHPYEYYFLIALLEIEARIYGLNTNGNVSTYLKEKFVSTPNKIDPEGRKESIRTNFLTSRQEFDFTEELLNRVISLIECLQKYDWEIFHKYLLRKDITLHVPLKKRYNFDELNSIKSWAKNDAELFFKQRYEYTVDQLLKGKYKALDVLSHRVVRLAQEADTLKVCTYLRNAYEKQFLVRQYLLTGEAYSNLYKVHDGITTLLTDTNNAIQLILIVLPIKENAYSALKKGLINNHDLSVDYIYGKYDDEIVEYFYIAELEKINEENKYSQTSERSFAILLSAFEKIFYYAQTIAMRKGQYWINKSKICIKSNSPLKEHIIKLFGFKRSYSDTHFRDCSLYQIQYVDLLQKVASFLALNS